MSSRGQRRFEAGMRRRGRILGHTGRMPEPGSSAKSPALAAALVGVAALVAHLPTLGGGFIWLDHAHIEDGLAVARPASWSSFFTGGFAETGFYRPLVAVSLSVDALLGGSPLVFHLTTLFFHVAASAMVTVAAGALGLSLTAGFLSGLLFAVHPVTSLVASAIAFRSESMAAVALLALVTWHRRRRAAAAAVALVVGGLCKETALALAPLFIVALELDERAVAPGARRRVLLAEALGLALVLALRVFYAPSWRAVFPPMDASEAVGTRLASLAKSATALVPVGLWDRTICDAFPVTQLVAPTALAGALVAGALVFAARRVRGAFLFLALAVLPSLQLVPVMRWWSPHYLYVPLAFLAMAAGRGFERALGRPLPWVLALAVALGARTFQDDSRFESDSALWDPEVRAHPECREGQFYVGEDHRVRREWDVAGEHYERARKEESGILSYVDLKSTLVNLAVVRLEQGRPKETAELLREALQVATSEIDRRKYRHNLAVALAASNDLPGAAALLERECARPDAFPESLMLGARVFHALGREDEALALLKRLATRGQP